MHWAYGPLYCRWHYDKLDRLFPKLQRWRIIYQTRGAVARCSLKCTGCHFKWGAGHLWAHHPVSATAVATLLLSRDPTWRLSACSRARVMDWVGESHHLVVHALTERGRPHMSNDICLESSKAGFKYFGFKVTFVSIVHTEEVISQIQLRLPKRRFLPQEHAVQLCDCQSWCFTNYSWNLLPIFFLITYKSLSRLTVSYQWNHLSLGCVSGK